MISLFYFLISNPPPVTSISKRLLFFADVILYPLPTLVILLCFYYLYLIIFLWDSTDRTAYSNYSAGRKKSIIYLCLYSDSFPSNSQNCVCHIDDCWSQLNQVQCCVLFLSVCVCVYVLLGLCFCLLAFN